MATNEKNDCVWEISVQKLRALLLAGLSNVNAYCSLLKQQDWGQVFQFTVTQYTDSTQNFN
jgi:hypothetical protein